MNAKDIAYGYAIGYNDGIQNSGSGGGEDIYVLSASVAGIAIQTITGRATASPTINTISFTFDTKVFKTETVAKTSQGEIRRTWSKTIITAVKNAGNIVWQCDTNNTGTITAVYDKLGNEILTGTTAISNNSVLTSTPEGIALGWALAYSNEQNSLVEKLTDAYEDGINDDKEISVEDEEPIIEVVDMHGSGAVVKRTGQRLNYRRATFIYYCDYVILTVINNNTRNVRCCSNSPVQPDVKVYAQYADTGETIRMSEDDTNWVGFTLADDATIYGDIRNTDGSVV